MYENFSVFVAGNKVSQEGESIGVVIT